MWTKPNHTKSYWVKQRNLTEPTGTEPHWTNRTPTSSTPVRSPLLYHKGSPQGLFRAPPKGVPGLNRSESRGRWEGGWRKWPMDVHERRTDVLGVSVTTRATSCHLCLLRRLLLARAMMTRRGASASPVPRLSLTRLVRLGWPPLPGHTWPRRSGLLVLPKAVQATPWPGCPALSYLGLLPG
jgi:hypothetical protein